MLERERTHFVGTVQPVVYLPENLNLQRFQQLDDVCYILTRFLQILRAEHPNQRGGTTLQFDGSLRTFGLARSRKPSMRTADCPVPTRTPP